MGDFGAFQVNRPCRHAYVNLEMDLEAGRYEPKDMDEFVAMEHLAGVQTPSGPSEPFAVKLEDPKVPAPDADIVASAPEPPLAEPPAPPTSEPATGAPVDQPEE